MISLETRDVYLISNFVKYWPKIHSFSDVLKFWKLGILHIDLPMETYCKIGILSCTVTISFSFKFNEITKYIKLSKLYVHEVYLFWF